MRVIYTNLCNMRARLPKGAERDDVGPLPCLRQEFDGETIILSWWQPTAVERLKIVAGANIRLAVIGSTTPPVVVEVDPDGAVEVPTPGAQR